MADDGMTPENDNDTEDRQLADHAAAKHERPSTAHHAAEHSDDEEVVALDDETPAAGSKPSSASKPNRPSGNWLLAHKAVTIPAAVVLVVALLAAIPVTRFALVGLVWKQTLPVAVIDAQTHQQVTAATVSLGGQTATTNAAGIARIKVAVGSKTLTVSKKYYKTASQSVTVPILRAKDLTTVRLTATGRQVPVAVFNTISGQPVNNATIKTTDSSAITGKAGQTNLVVPAGKSTISATISANGFNTTDVTLTVTDKVVVGNAFKVTPAGQVYFLSNASGKIDVVKTNLDGTGRETVIPGTGKEIGEQTLLLATSDWKFLALKAVRDDSGKAKLFLINTSTGKITTMDEGDAEFTPVGWSGHYFTYTVSRNQLQYYQAGKSALKSFNADSNQLLLLDQTQVEGNQSDYAYQSFGNVNILNNQLVYSVIWYNGNYYVDHLPGKSDYIRGIQPNGQNKKDYKTFDAGSSDSGGATSINAALLKPQTIYFQVGTAYGKQLTYWEFENNTVTSADSSEADAFNGNSSYASLFLISPSGNKSFWTQARDGKNTLFIGDQNAGGQQQIGSLTDYIPYGWYSDDYVLMAKNSSELYIAPAAPWKSGSPPLKITDYYRPSYGFNGYSYGYGGR